MNSKEFLKTACNILFKSMDIAIETTLDKDRLIVAEKVRSNTISKYLNNGKSNPYTPIAKEIFLNRVRYNIFPEEFRINSSELEINVFLNKCIYLLSTLFNLNFCFLKLDDFEEYRKNVYFFVEKFSDLFSQKYELEQDDIRKFILKEYYSNINAKNLFTKDDIDEYLLDLGNSNASTQHLPKVMRDEQLRLMYNNSVDYLNHCKDFFECLFTNSYGNNTVRNAAKEMYKINIKNSNDFNDEEFDKKFDKIYFKGCNWKDNLINFVFENGVIISIDGIIGYIVNIKESNIKILNLIKDFEIFTNQYNAPEAYTNHQKYMVETGKQTNGEQNLVDNYDRILDKNIFVIFNKHYTEIYCNLQKIKKYNLIKRAIYTCLNIELGSD